ncbi:MAG: hypothetical protein AB8U25_06550 [Rickettsiales endosymbiont of Dermacentor nuttalli]
MQCKEDQLLEKLLENKNKLISLQNDTKSHIANQILTLLSTNQGQLLKDFSLLINSIDKKQLLQEMTDSV